MSEQFIEAPPDLAGEAPVDELHEFDAFNPEFGQNLEQRLQEIDALARERLQGMLEPLAPADVRGGPLDGLPPDHPAVGAAAMEQARELVASFGDELNGVDLEETYRVAETLYPFAVDAVGGPGMEAAEVALRAAAQQVA